MNLTSFKELNNFADQDLNLLSLTERSFTELTPNLLDFTKLILAGLRSTEFHWTWKVTYQTEITELYQTELNYGTLNKTPALRNFT